MAVLSRHGSAFGCAWTIEAQEDNTLTPFHHITLDASWHPSEVVVGEHSKTFQRKARCDLRLDGVPRTD